ncbi:MAG: MBL fold metallo-hydrolase [Chloroflexota bacterium]
MEAQSSPAEAALTVVPFVLGPVETNAYLVADSTEGTAVAIDPAWDGHILVNEARRRGWRIVSIWLTHAHFDHLGGAAAVAEAFNAPVALHPDDQSLWRFNGGAALFGFPHFDPGPEPTISLTHGMKLWIGRHELEVRHTPGHTPGHVVFVASASRLVFCGDLIFYNGVGRTDLPGGNWETLQRSIEQHILTLPDDTRLLSGHGPETTVGHERRTNPFLNAGW